MILVFLFLLLMIVVVGTLGFGLVLGARRARNRELQDWRARTATLEGAGSHLSTRPD